MGPSRAAASAATAWLALAAAGCVDAPAQLVALHGCGLEQESGMDGLRVIVRGDFPSSESTQLLLAPGEHGELNTLPAGARALTVEGLVGDFVAAVGRTRGIGPGGSDGGEDLVAYFAPENSLCSVPSGVGHRERGGIAVGGSGELLLTGGYAENGTLLDEIVRVDLESQLGEVLDATLPAPTAGQSLHAIAGRRFLMIGGARASGRWFSTLEIDLDQGADAVQAPINLELGDQPRGIAYAGTARGPDGRVLVAGGCTTIDAQAHCAVAAAPNAAGVSALAFWIDPKSLEVERVPDLTRARHDPIVLVGRDGVAYVVGGRDGEDAPVPTLERLAVGATAWQVLADDVTAPAPVAGASLIEDGLIVVAHADGSVSWYGDEATGVIDLGQNLDAHARRPLLTLAGERVLADVWVLPVGSAAGGSAQAIDLVEQTPAGAGPGVRLGPELMLLDDGSALLAGGRTPEGEVAVPFLARARPPLDGPDERVPDVAQPDPDAFLSTPPDAALVDDDALVLEAGGQIEDYPSARTHVRGFRSHRFGFDFVIDTQARAHVLLLQGALAGLSLRLDPDGIVATRRDQNDKLTPADCDPGPAPMVDGSASLRLDVSPAGITLEQAGQAIVTCTALTGPEPAVGFGVSGQGQVRVRKMRLRRR